MVFWLIFSIVGVQFFGGRFYKCVDSQGERLPISIVQNRSDCDRLGYRWINSNINFDNAGNGFIALFQVVSLWYFCQARILESFIGVRATQSPWKLPKNHLNPPGSPADLYPFRLFIDNSIPRGFSHGLTKTTQFLGDLPKDHLMPRSFTNKLANPRGGCYPLIDWLRVVLFV